MGNDILRVCLNAQASLKKTSPNSPFPFTSRRLEKRKRKPIPQRRRPKIRRLWPWGGLEGKRAVQLGQRPFRPTSEKKLLKKPPPPVGIRRSKRFSQGYLLSIPALNQSGVLPPFTGDDPALEHAMAPYRVSFLELAQRFGTSPHRCSLLKGLVSYRQGLRGVGIERGFQWIDGSFVEDIENSSRQRPPSDIDIVTFSLIPMEFRGSQEVFDSFVNSNEQLFDCKKSKAIFHCDAYFIDMAIPAPHLVSYTRYYFGLFSHRRETYLWKGMLEIPLTSDDSEVTAYLNRSGTDA